MVDGGNRTFASAHSTNKEPRPTSLPWSAPETSSDLQYNQIKSIKYNQSMMMMMMMIDAVVLLER